MYGRGACDMKSGTIGCARGAGCDRGRRLPAEPGGIHFQSVIEEESTGGRRTLDLAARRIAPMPASSRSRRTARW